MGTLARQSRSDSERRLLRLLDVLADGAFEAGAGGGVVAQGLDLGGAGFGQSGLGAEDIELGAGAGFVTGGGKAKSFVSLFLDFFLRFEKFRSFNKSRVGRANFLLDAASGIGDFHAGALME